MSNKFYYLSAHCCENIILTNITTIVLLIIADTKKNSH